MSIICEMEPSEDLLVRIPQRNRINRRYLSIYRCFSLQLYPDLYLYVYIFACICMYMYVYIYTSISIFVSREREGKRLI